MREIVLDTETTGLDPKSGHRIIEIGCLELFNHVPTGNTFQCYVNPGRDIPEDALAVHGISATFLADKPTFENIVEDMLQFLGEDKLVIHNAAFDLGFLNAELGRAGRPTLPFGRAIDTVELARRKFPGAPASLDALCRRFGVDNTARTLHGALLDAELLAEVYLELIGGRQPHLALVTAATSGDTGGGTTVREHRPPRPHAPTSQELADHAAFVEKLCDPIWLR